MESQPEPPDWNDRMHQLDEALDREIDTLDTVFLRLTTMRLLLAAGKDRLIDRAAAELETAMEAFEAAEEHVVSILADAGHQTLSDAAVASEPAERARLERCTSILHGLHREVRVALSTTGAAAERSLHTALLQLDTGSEGSAPRVRANNPFLTLE